MSKIKVIVKRPFEPVGRIREIENTLEAFQNIVGGYIQAVPVALDVAIICNEEGRLQGLPHNCDIVGTNFVGPIVVVGVKSDEFTDYPGDLESWERYWIGGNHGKK